MNQATQFRRDLHQIPETSFTEFKTREYVVSVLKTLHCELIELLETGVAAYFDAGRPATLAYRADMDALPIQEETGLEFASRHPGKMARLRPRRPHGDAAGICPGAGSA